jgi:lipopolysaccharide biosynthesis glycosyltransferase
MHSLFQLRFGLPYHPNLNPVFVSFHLNTIKALTPETIAYLKAHGPIGCRDWTTVDLLLSAGVDAFFTGCLSTTVNAIFPKIDDVEREQPGAVAVIDAPVAPVKANRPIEALTHRDPRYREADLAEGTRLAIELLETYQRRYHRIVTSRLHSYLPAISLGVPVKFKPRRIGDVRFDGLLGMTPDAPELTAMRDGIRRLLAATFEKIFAGASRDEVYAQWREITASQVAEARKRQEAPLQPDESVRAIDIPALVKTVREGARTFGPHDAVDPATVSDLALAVDHNLRQHLPTTLESLIGNASSPLRLWVLSRGLDEGYQQWISDAWPDVPITFLNLDGIKYGDIGRMNPAITVSTMDRLVLSELLSDLDRITYVDVDTVTEGDVCELAATDLGGYPLAARTAVYSAAEQWRAAGNLLSAEKASELRRMMSARHAFDYKGFNAGVLVLDLARMRADDFAATHLPLVARFGMHDQDVLVAYVGPNRAELDEKWNALPIREEITATGIIHFVGPLKPWNEELTPYGEHWKLYAERVRARVGEPPASPDGVEERLVPTTTALSRPVEVVLHVGMGKTGTSSIQFFLRDNRERLAGLGVLFPTSPGRARHARLSLFSKTEEELVRLPEWARQKDSDPAQFRSDFRRQLFAEIEDSGLARVLFSDEVIFGSPNPVLRRLHGLLDQFAKRLRLVAYLRRQDEHMVSRYQQGVKIGWVMRLREWAAEDMTELYDYHARLQRLEQLLAPSELVVRRFEQDAFADGSLFQDFLDAAGIDARAGEMEPVASRNKSLDAESVEFLRLLNVHRVVSDGATPGLIDNRQLVARLAEVSSGPKLTMPAPFLDEFMAQWEESNSAVAREFLGDESGQLFRSRREARNTTTKQHFDPARLDHFVTLLELPEEIHAPLRRLAEREATVR